MTRVSALLGTLVIVFLCGLPPAHAFECPQPAMPSPGVLQETAQEQQALTQMFAGGNIENKIGVAVADLQRKYPAASDTELVNYMIGAYCPAVAQMPGLSDQQRTARVEHFAATLFELLSEQKL
ncbi:MAG: hypothetical protein IPK78_17145 [Rhodospirillales bacterium]|nr:hypothetical protein [Rhodospirillales bacterium]